MFINKSNLTPPNDMGYQFGINDSLTKYAHSEQYNWGNILPPVDINVLEVWKDNKFQTFLFVDSKTNKELCDVQGYEAAAAKLDIFKLQKISKKLENEI